MGQTTLAVTAPHTTAYDSDYPTRSTENYSHQLHEILQDMEDASGNWYLEDGRFVGETDRNSWCTRCYGMIKDVFDYAEDAITNYRSTGTPSLSLPVLASVQLPNYGSGGPAHLITIQTKLWTECMGMMFKIYYMWETEEDPLLLKEKLQELLVAWPLLDTTIELQNDMGQSFKVYPSWKNADLDL